MVQWVGKTMRNAGSDPWAPPHGNPLMGSHGNGHPLDPVGSPWSPWVRPGVSHGFAYPLDHQFFLAFSCFLPNFPDFFLIFSYLGPIGPHGGALGPQIFSREPRPPELALTIF